MTTWRDAATLPDDGEPVVAVLSWFGQEWQVVARHINGEWRYDSRGFRVGDNPNVRILRWTPWPS